MVAILRLVRSLFASICLPIGLSIGSAAGLWRGTLAALLVAVGVAPVTAQSVQFFGNFQYYSQDRVQNAQGLVANAQGDLYVSGSHALSYIPVDVNGAPSSSGTTVSCSPGSGEVMGMAIDASNHIFRADPSLSAVQMFTFSGSPTNCSLGNIGSDWHLPSSVTVDSSSNVYVLDGWNGAIYELTPGSGYSPTEVCSSATLINTTGLSIDSAGNFYIASGSDYGTVGTSSLGTPAATAVYKVTGSGGGACSTTAIGSGWTSPSATTADAAGNVWVVDYGAGTVNLLVPDGGGGYNQMVYQSITNIRTLMVNQAGKLYGFAYATAGGNGDATVWTGGTPPHNLGTYAVGTPAPTVTLTVDFMSAVIADGFNPTTQGAYARDFQAVGGTCTPASYSASQSCTVEVTFTPKAPGLRTGALVVTDESGNVLGTNYLYGTGVAPQATFNPGTTSVISLGSTTVLNPGQVAFDGSGNMYVTEQYTGTTTPRVLKIPAGGGSYTDITPSVSIRGPYGIVLDGAGNYYISDSWGGIVAVNAAGQASSLNISGLTPNLSAPQGLAMDAQGNLYIADMGNTRVVKVAIQNAGTTSVTGIGTVVSTGGYTFSEGGITGVAVDSLGDLYITDLGNNAVVMVTPSGTASPLSIPGSATLNGPRGVSVDGFGNVYITNQSSGQIVEQTSAGVTTVLSTAGLSGGLNNPFNTAVDSSGKVYICDASNDRLVEVDPTTPYAVPFANTNVGSTSGPQTFTLTNIGDQSLVMSGLSYPTNFPVNTSDSNLCTSNTTLGAGTACDVSINFTPTTTGSLSGNVQLTDNNLLGSGVIQSISVSGPASQGTPTVTWPTASSISYGQTLVSSTLSGGASTPAGTFAFTTPGTAPPTGTNSQSVTFTPTDTTDYLTVVGSANVTVNKAAPSSITWPTASRISFGQTLVSSTLSGGASTPAGTFAFTTPGTAPP
ncbi:MAG: choice-of-anchor D domain-containing protein, partial [Terracidiphilus sp.]